MGGRAFTDIGASNDPPFTTPRIPPHIYEQLKDIAIKAVSKHYAKVIHLPEAPSKLDYGDVDLVVESPYSTTAIQDVSRELNAIKTIENPSNYLLAIPRPDTQGLLSTISARLLPSFFPPQNIFAQLDISVCLSGYLEWTNLFKGYGDLGQIIGVMIYAHGFTVNDKGFHVRIKEQEVEGKKASKASLVFLTKEPDEVMDFLHLNKQEFANGFESEDHLFRWACKCRLLNTDRVNKRRDDPKDRKRLETRSMFRRFVSVYVPSLPRTDPTTVNTRETLLKEALSFFDKEQEFTCRRNIVLIEMAEDHAWSTINTTVLTPFAGLSNDKLNEVVRAFKRFVAFTADEPYIREDPEMVTENQARFAIMIDDTGNIKPEMKTWILEHWEDIKGLERQRVKDRKKVAMRE